MEKGWQWHAACLYDAALPHVVHELGLHAVRLCFWPHQILVVMHVYIADMGSVWLQQVMKDPVTAADGHTYERGAIVHWMHANSISPVTHQPLHNKHLTPNTQIKIALNRMKQSERIH